MSTFIGIELSVGETYIIWTIDTEYKSCRQILDCSGFLS